MPADSYTAALLLADAAGAEAACAADLPMCNMTGCCCPSPANFVDAGGISLESASGI